MMLELGARCLLMAAPFDGVECIVVGTAIDPQRPRPYLVEMTNCGLRLEAAERCLLPLDAEGEHWNPHVECAHADGLPMDDARKWADQIEHADMQFVYQTAADAIERAKNGAKA